MTRNHILAVGLALLAMPAAGQDYIDPVQLRAVNAVRVELIDNITNGCLPQPTVLKLRAERLLRRSGIIIGRTTNEKPHKLRIVLKGGETIDGSARRSGYCKASYYLELSRIKKMSDGFVGEVQAFVSTGSSIGPKLGFQDQLGDLVAKAVNALCKEISSLHRNGS
jgi:hypothetical protein